MPQIKFSIDHSQFDAKLGRILPETEEAIETALKPVAQKIAHDAQGAALAHIRFFGDKPGRYLASIYGGTFRKPGAVGGFVRSKSPLAHLLELGFTYKEQDIFPKNEDVMAFYWENVGQVVLKHVHRQSMRIPDYPALGPAFAAAQDGIHSAIAGAAKAAG